MKLLLHETRKLHEERNKKAVSVFERKMYNITKKSIGKRQKQKKIIRFEAKTMENENNDYKLSLVGKCTIRGIKTARKRRYSLFTVQYPIFPDRNSNYPKNGTVRAGKAAGNSGSMKKAIQTEKKPHSLQKIPLLAV